MFINTAKQWESHCFYTRSSQYIEIEPSKKRNLKLIELKLV